jgi:hypothetical protein
MRYQKALGYLGSGFHVSSNTVDSYNDDSLLIIFDLEKSAAGHERHVDSRWKRHD